eukprot:gene15429-21512_t
MFPVPDVPGGPERPLSLDTRVWRCRGCSVETASGQTEYPNPRGGPLYNHIPQCAGLKAALKQINAISAHVQKLGPSCPATEQLEAAETKEQLYPASDPS